LKLEKYDWHSGFVPHCAIRITKGDFSMDMSFQEAINLYLDIVKRFEKIEQRAWGAEGAMIELSKQVGQLAKHVMQQENYYCYAGGEDNIKNIEDELADIFGQIIRIAGCYNIDILMAHINARKGEDNFLKSRGV